MSLLKKVGSGKTFYIRSYQQIEHLCTIFKTAPETWEKYEHPNVYCLKDIISYFKYVVIRLPAGKIRLDALIQFPVRKTVNSAKRLFADMLGIFKLYTVERVHNPLVIANIKLEILQKKCDVVESGSQGEFSYGGRGRQKIFEKYLKAFESANTDKYCLKLDV
jgi:hypothetical protein